MLMMRKCECEETSYSNPPFVNMNFLFPFYFLGGGGREMLQIESFMSLNTIAFI